jgi:hypothetical protein
MAEKEEKKKRKYVKPTITRIALDNTISLVMMSHGNGHGHDKPPKPPKPPKPKGAFDSPFGSDFN